MPSGPSPINNLPVFKIQVSRDLSEFQIPSVYGHNTRSHRHGDTVGEEEHLLVSERQPH